MIALLIAVLLNQRLAGRNFARAVVFLPTILGLTVIGLIFTLIFNPSAGPAQQLWAAFGTSSAFFGDPKLAMALVILVQVWCGIGVAVVIYLAGLQAIPPELYEVADIDGATSWPAVASRDHSAAGPGCHREHPAIASSARCRATS